MSHLSLPRIHFQGEFVTNVATANNDDIVKLVNVAVVGVDIRDKSDSELRQWLKEFQPPTPEQRGGIRAGWNYYGNNGCRFQDVTVTCIELAGRVITGETEDPLIGASVALDQAVMVDIDPEGSRGTQIFCDGFRVHKDQTVFWEGPTTRFYSRWLTFRRNLRARGFARGAAVWQAAILRDQLTFPGAPSPALEALRAAAEAGGGLVIRFCTYLVATRITDEELARQFAEGKTTANPAFGRVVGSIGPLHSQELTSVTVGRLLRSSARLVEDHVEYQLGPAVAQIDRERRVVSLDLINAFPERNETREKVNVGPVSLQVRHGDRMFNLGPIAYHQTAYEATAGIVDVSYSEDVGPHLDEGQFLLVHDASKTALLVETDWTVETDDRAIYLQEGETQPVRLRLVKKGQPPEKKVAVRLEQYVTSDIKGLPDAPAGPDTQVVEMPAQISVRPDGGARLRLKAKRPGTCMIRFVPAEETGSPFDPTTDFFTNVRVLPADNYDHIPDEQLTFEFIYREVLRYYYLVYPAMSRIIDFSNEQAVRIHAADIEELTSPKLWHSAAYMPRTRELSDGKRKLLHRWCRLNS
jgi:hypothetical protein